MPKYIVGGGGPEFFDPSEFTPIGPPLVLHQGDDVEARVGEYLADWRERAKGMVHRVPIAEGGSVDDLIPSPEQDGGSADGS